MRVDNKIILDLCGGTGSWSKPYKDAGYNVKIITLPEYNIKDWNCYPEFYRKIRQGKIYGILAAPPCTMFSLARTTAQKPRDLKEGMECVRACVDIIWTCRENGNLKFWALENPMGYLRQFLGKPAFTFDASEFGCDYNKHTDLWGYFKEPKKNVGYNRFPSTDKNTRRLPTIPVDYKIDKNMSRTAVRRSITPLDFTQAFYKANK